MDSSSKKRAIVAAVAVGALYVAVFGAADATLRHGYSATWYAEDDGERFALDRTTEHRAVFPNVHRALARYVNGWDHERMPRPAGIPTIDAVLRARLEVPPGAGRKIEADADREAVIWADGSRVGPDFVLAPGPHDLWIHWQASPRPHGRSRRSPDTGHLRLLWGAARATQPIPASALTPAEGAWGAERTTLWAVGIPLFVFFVLLAFFAERSAVAAARARRWAVLLTVALIGLGTAYRTYDYDVMPEYRENGDELFAAWNGWSILEDGTPRGWSLWSSSYEGKVEVEEIDAAGHHWRVITPYFEHPPLLHVLVGAAAHLGGAQHWSEAKLAHTRLVPIGLSAITLLLLVLVARRFFPRGPAPYLAGLLYAVLPTIALQTRVVKEEVLLAPLLLASIWFFLRWRDDGKKLRDLVGASIFAGLATLAKVPAIVWVPALVMLVAAERGETKRAVIAAAIGIAMVMLFPLFGAIVDWDIFVLTQRKQGLRPTHWNIFLRFFDAGQINFNHVGRGWTLFLWIGFASTTLWRGWRVTAPLTVPLATYLAAIAVGAGNWTYGWYAVPFYPLLCIGAGDFLARLYARPNLLSGAIFIVLPVMYTLNFTLDPAVAKSGPEWPALRRMITLFVGGFLTPYALVQVWRENKSLVRLARLGTALALAVLVIGSAFFVVNYETIYESHNDFDLDAYFVP